MMISPESYYEMVLKGKSIKEINREIQNLKQKIGIIKYQLEKASLLDYGEPLLSASKNINIYKLYLERAKDVLSEVGGEYKPSKSDLKVIRFNENINAIIKIVFCIGGYKIGYETRNYSLVDDHFLIRVDYGLKFLGCDKGQEIETPMAKELLLEGIKDLGMVKPFLENSLIASFCRVVAHFLVARYCVK